MEHHVIVSFGENRELEFKASSAGMQGQGADEARQWFDREFIALECDLPTPIGKLLLADRVLSVAKYAGERRFRDDPHWAQLFARNAGALLGREVIRVDVANQSVGY
jgi:hypothetical protein